MVADLLAEVPVFAALSQPDRVEAATHMRARRFARDEVVFHRDDPAAHMYVIAIPDESGHEVVIAMERGGGIFGQLALFDDAPRSATVTAINETQVLALSREDFLRVIERNPKAMKELLALLARMIRRASGRIEDLVFLDVSGRVAKCLLDISTAQGKSEIEMTQDDVAAFVGATRVSVNRALADLESQGALSVGRRHIVVKDVDRLRKQIRY